MTVRIEIIGVVPPCPRCERMYSLTMQAAEKLGAEVKIRKISFDSEAARRYGRVGTAHDIAEWAGFDMDWSRVRDIVTDGWSQELDDFLMPCAERARDNGWLMTPVLVINDVVEHMGSVPDKEAVSSAIKKHMEHKEAAQ